MTKVWEEDWNWDAVTPSVRLCANKRSQKIGEMWGTGLDQSEARNRLASAAPDMARNLAWLEWSWESIYHAVCCPRCSGGRAKGHAADCELDRALTKAGLSDQRSRNALRKAMDVDPEEWK